MISTRLPGVEYEANYIDDEKKLDAYLIELGSEGLQLKFPGNGKKESAELQLSGARLRDFLMEISHIEDVLKRMERKHLDIEKYMEARAGSPGYPDVPVFRIKTPIDSYYVYSEEEMEVARASGERLLDTLAAVETARRLMALLRQRIAHVRVLEGQGRRVLHYHVLPQLPAAILY